jgi:hypothetical protein
VTDFRKDNFPVDPEATTKPMMQREVTVEKTRATLTPEARDVRHVDTARRAAIPLGSGTAAATAPAEERVPLFAATEANDLRARWDSVQVGFVDEPRKAVQEAEALVADAAKRLSEIFANERRSLESQWDRGDVSTEDLRLALRRYRSFFTRLLSI